VTAQQAADLGESATEGAGEADEVPAPVEAE
jgi:hypothetical protein